MESNRTMRSLTPLLFFFVILEAAVTSTAAGGGQWTLLQHSIGVSAMHMQLLHTDRVIVFDRTDFGPSNLSLPAGHCRNDPSELALSVDCTAHSAEYDVAANTFRPLTVLTDTWCSSGIVDGNGTLVQTGGYNDGERAARTYRPCYDYGCDWAETPQALAVMRWYATNHILPDGRAIVVGGRQQLSYEFYPKTNPSAVGTFALRFLQETGDDVENNLYPFVHLNIDGNLFIYANNRSILFDYKKNAVVRTYPSMPGGDPRNYPSSGSSVLLPLKPSSTEAEVLICGGAPKGSYAQALQGKSFLPALDTCGRIKITDEAPSWSMEKMPVPRIMGDMVLLPTGEVLIINGAAAGTAGWEHAREPVLTPVIYRPENPPGARFEVLSPAATPRLYHSTAVLLRDGRVLVGGSNPHMNYSFSGVEFPTELSLEAFSPPYLSAGNSALRPQIVAPPSPIQLSYGRRFSLQFTVGKISDSGVRVTMLAPPFATHSFSMNQRLLVLESNLAAGDGGARQVVVEAPASEVLAPSGYYMVYVVNGGVPSEGVWVHIQ
ncbi:aldehyde oxidase GLOX-like [Canna indica]|uniref:Aldehyde oxidase GLOX n=1 Tax=Canna indica TaxID=4628 RepID=A0AAQ3KQN9_9LILI|nr:aldehyde oxidase GLOX-like [Canna indica]WOL12664.1 aldehyde oxidase GLOX-like [Canna indica]